ncbi:MAG TPA: hydrogen gas-evolving membrane-bound hydrogenase subunit E [Vicinamibacterales bacterium]
MIVLLILSPFLVAPLAAWLVGRSPRSARVLALWPAFLTVMLGAELRSVLASGPRLVERAWAPSLGLSLSFNLDGLGLLFALMITGIGALVVLYASRYFEGHPQAGGFHATLFAFMGAMLGVVLSDDILLLFVFWELTGFTSFLLIGFEHEQEGARSAAIQALIVTGAGGLALMAAGVLLYSITGTVSLTGMMPSQAAIAAHPFYTAIAVLVFFAAFTKSAQAPFHFWLPNAMAAPTPVSAYLHSATMVKAGIYLAQRMTPILGGTVFWMSVVTAAGAITMAIGAYRAVKETDLKRILAYTTISALGVLMMLVGAGTREAAIAALAYFVAHALYKGALFLVAGAIDHETGTRDITVLAGLRRAMPITAVAGGAAALSMAGVPLTFGFVGKEAAYEALLHAGDWSLLLIALTVGASILLGLGGLLAGVLPFRGTADERSEVHEPAWELWLPPLVLAAASVLLGIVPGLIEMPLTSAATAILRDPAEVSLAIWHGFTPTLLLSAVTLLGVWLAYVFRGSLRQIIWVPVRGAEHIYTGTIWTLNAISQVIAPALHSASLRSYVMVIVLTSIAFGGTALATASTIATFTPTMDVAPYELLIILTVIAGAISATVARSTMAAVLSLGVVGYGVAMTFLLFSAPDLAMTQFSVETLTVLIYVLVFRHFRGLGAVSPRLVRLRDAVIALGMGTIIGGLVLSVATTDTVQRLTGYFVENAPTLGHGRNVVNVILVDFRAFDTLGEITVLATAAIGVRALLRLAWAERSARRAVAEEGKR